MKKVLTTLCVLAMTAIAGMAFGETDPNQVLAKVNNEEILQKDVDEIVAVFVMPQFKAQNPDKEMPAEQRQQIEKQVLDQLVTERILLQEAAKLNVTVDQKELADRIAQVKPQRPDLTDEQWTSFLTRDMMIQKLIQQEVVSKIVVSDEDVQKFYDEQKDRFHEPEKIRASHILVLVPQDATPEAKDAAKKKIDGVLEEINAGKDFAELAKANSEDPGSKDNGGDLDFFPRGAMVKPFEDAAFALKDGEVSGVVETQFGYHIIKKTGEKAERDVPLDEVKDQLKGSLTKQKTNTEVMAWVDNLKKQSTIEMTNATPTAQATPETATEPDTAATPDTTNTTTNQ
ncbi:PpiC-type peptidyl-prolyl cis-trans isomerase [Candidatus Moduliflexus flocculans]|uniref:PpiC-type peptidyl-prolyl cis-trans isomerase n=1 Tax=Candidatus Moduliflexus flocculans TaxID=1499966 RepID=A0A0S6W3I5_9BACT|nr:PpiC-type peptidyl-prolyl cis-trans isomerase [Candidatus Moduliflexus flocculans]